jgi:PRTRC genetic system protein A
MEYLIGSNGIFVRAIRPEFQVILPVVADPCIFKGLSAIQPQISLTCKVPESLLLEMWREACIACPNEVLFHLILESNQWRLIIPEQATSTTSCTPVVGQTSSQHAAIEVHSHGMMSASFSPTDDLDERSCFRIFGVMGKVRSPSPQLQLRVGVFGHCWVIPLESVFETSSDTFMRSVIPSLNFYTLS